MERFDEHSVSAAPLGGAFWRGRRLWWAVLVVALAVSTSGCYRYSRADLETLPPTTDVRLHLTWAALEGRDDLAEANIINTEDRPVVSGTLLERDPSSVMLGVRIRNPGTSYPGTPIQQRVTIPLDAIWDAEARSLRRLETGLLVAGGIAAVVLVIDHIVGDAISNGSNPPPLEDWDESRMPLPARYFGR